YLLCLHLLQVFFFRKQEPPTDREESVQFAKRLANIGMSLPAYKRAYNLDNEESVQHSEDYSNRKLQTRTPTKRRPNKGTEDSNTIDDTLTTFYYS
ncbi:hypothetical protein P5673_030320, partial [Acropora cervicornis]